MGLNKVLKVNSDSELMSYIINVTPELSSEIDLPVQGQSLAPIGKLIMSNERFKNAFINTINLIGLTVIDRNYWENPWEGFTNRGTLNFGQSVRELMVDIADVYDYNAYAENPNHFLENVVPNVFNYIHEINYQKFYKTTTSDEQMAMAFNTEGGLMDLIEKIIGSLYEAYKYDKYLVDKYMLCRRILDGTITSVEIDNYASLTPRQRVAFIKNISNKMTFRSPNYNPAGVRVATPFADQIMILNTDFEADLSTDVLATSFFIDEAKFKTDLALIDGYGSHDTARLMELLGSAYIPFTDDELTALSAIPCVIVDREFFQDYNYSLDNMADGSVNGTRSTNFFNPETLKNNHWLHTWKVISTSPFKQAVVFTKDVAPNVTSVTVSPSSASVSAGQKLQLSATVATAGFANKAVQWSISHDGETREGKKATINNNGLLTIPAGHVYGNGTQGTYTVTISTAMAATDTVIIAGVEYTPAADDDTAAEQAAALATLFASNTHYTVTQGTSSNANKLTFVEKSGYYGIGKPLVNTTDVVTGVFTEATTTPGVPSGAVTVTATSIYKNSVSGSANITVTA